MAAGVALMQTLPPGSHVVFPHDAYYGFAVAGREFLANWGIATDFVDMTDLAQRSSARSVPARGWCCWRRRRTRCCAWWTSSARWRSRAAPAR